MSVCLSHCIILIFLCLKQTGNLTAHSLDLLLVVYKRRMLRLGGFCLCVNVTTLLISTFVSGVPSGQFHGRTQSSNLNSFFERAASLVREVIRLADTAENQEDVVEYCISRLENLLSNCVNLFELSMQPQSIEVQCLSQEGRARG